MDESVVSKNLSISSHKYDNENDEFYEKRRDNCEVKVVQRYPLRRSNHEAFSNLDQRTRTLSKLKSDPALLSSRCMRSTMHRW